MDMTEDQKAAAIVALDKRLFDLTPRDLIWIAGFLAAATDEELAAVAIPTEIRDL